jgi:hypothetical protein
MTSCGPTQEYMIQPSRLFTVLPDATLFSKILFVVIGEAVSLRLYITTWIPAKWSAYQIPSVIVVFVILVSKV